MSPATDLETDLGTARGLEHAPLHALAAQSAILRAVLFYHVIMILVVHLALVKRKGLCVVH